MTRIELIGGGGAYINPSMVEAIIPAERDRQKGSLIILEDMRGSPWRETVVVAGTPDDVNAKLFPPEPQHAQGPGFVEMT